MIRDYGKGPFLMDVKRGRFRTSCIIHRNMTGRFFFGYGDILKLVSSPGPQTWESGNRVYPRGQPGGLPRGLHRRILYTKPEKNPVTRPYPAFETHPSSAQRSFTPVNPVLPNPIPKSASLERCLWGILLHGFMDSWIHGYPKGRIHCTVVEMLNSLHISLRVLKIVISNSSVCRGKTKRQRFKVESGYLDVLR
jgi:hypothetical protein